jgi:hypothetical protein
MAELIEQSDSRNKNDCMTQDPPPVGEKRMLFLGGSK